MSEDTDNTPHGEAAEQTTDASPETSTSSRSGDDWRLKAERYYEEKKELAERLAAVEEKMKVNKGEGLELFQKERRAREQREADLKAARKEAEAARLEARELKLERVSDRLAGLVVDGSSNPDLARRLLRTVLGTEVKWDPDVALSMDDEDLVRTADAARKRLADIDPRLYAPAAGSAPSSGKAAITGLTEDEEKRVAGRMRALQLPRRRS